MYESPTKLDALMGLTMVNVEQIGEDEIVFTADNGRKFKLYHSQACCESVSVEDIEGNLSDLVGSPLLQVEESTSDSDPEDCKRDFPPDSYLWTFYKFATVKGYVTIRWLGESNGYYSESVDFIEL